MTAANPHRCPAPPQRFPVVALLRGAAVQIDLIDDLDRPGVSMPFAAAPVVVADIDRDAGCILRTLRDVVERVVSEAARRDLGLREDALLAGLADLTGNG